jgi:hypothetical protein
MIRESNGFFYNTAWIVLTELGAKIGFMVWVFGNPALDLMVLVVAR